MPREEEEKPKAFKVEDRRRFSAEGEPKPEQAPEQPSRAEPPPAPAPHAADTPPRIDTGPNFTTGGPRDRQGGAAGELTFATFMVGLSTQALVHLGEIPEPHSGKVEGDLRAAEQVIDIIAMLSEKTRGNLDADEAQLIETILFELRMKYVERARQSPH
jgi:Domain of unknown function (DUF1844)